MPSDGPAAATQVISRTPGTRRIGSVERYGVALAAAALALAAQFALRSLVSPSFYPIFLVAVAFSAWYGGFWPGLLTMAGAVVGALAIPVPPGPSLQMGAKPDVIRFSVFVLSGVVVSWLLASLLSARRRAERAAARTARVQALNLSLAPALTPREVAAIIVHHAVAALHAETGAIALLAEDGKTLELAHAEGLEGAREPELRARESAGSGPLRDAVRTSRPIFLESAAERRARYPDLARLDSPGGSLAALPFVPDGHPIGALELSFAHDRRLGGDDRRFMLVLAGQGAQALERARLYEAERSARRHAEEAREQVAFLAEASEILGSSLNYRETLSAVVRLIVPRLADFCAVDVVEADGRMRRIAIAHVDPAKVEAVWDMSRRYPLDPDDPVPRAMRSGEPQLVPVIPDALLQSFARDPEHLARLRAFGLRSLLIVPLNARGRTLGALTFVMADSGREYGRPDLLLAVDLARRAALAVDNARLFGDAETALQAKHETLALLDTVFAGAPVGLAFVDRDLRFVRINDALAAMHGVPPAAHLGRTLEEALGGYAAKVEPFFRQVLSSGEPVLDQELRLGLPGQPTGERILLVSYYPVHGPEAEVHWVGVVILDVTERKRADEALMQGQRMEAIAKVAGGVAHEVNNMMTVITGFSGFLEGAMPIGDPRLADVAEIRKAADRAAGITRQLLAYSRQQLLQPRPLDFNLLVQDLSGVLERLLGPEIGLQLTLAPDLRSVKADQAQLEQVLVNLTLNARDAIHGPGTLSIVTQNVYLDEGYAGRYPGTNIPVGTYVRVMVSDTGQGMDAATRARLFEPFFTTKPPGQGTGLGLATVYGIIKQSGGFIWVYSEPGRGTTFKIYLPAATEEALDLGESHTPLDVPGGVETILLAEDEPSVRRMVCRVLREGGYRVLEAINGAEALQIAQRETDAIHLVVSDLVMPVMGGRELGERLARVRPGIRVLYISGHTDDDVIRRGLLVPGSPFLQKPFEAAALARKVREVLDGTAQLHGA
jgi:PAS domain S-box-containing protein